jgi:hypothetical protein
MEKLSTKEYGKPIEVSYWYKGGSLGASNYEIYKKLNKIAIKEKNVDSQMIFNRLDEIANFIDQGIIKTFSEQTQNKFCNDWALGILILLRNGYIKNDHNFGIFKKYENKFGHAIYSL